MLIKFRLFEELKRKPSSRISIDDIFRADSNFTQREKALLEDDDFVVTDNKAICKEKYCIFEIEKEIDDRGERFILTIKDKDGKQLKSKGFAIDTNNTILSQIIDICVAYNDKVIKDLTKDVDPFDEENWDEDDKEKTPIVQRESPNDLFNLIRDLRRDNFYQHDQDDDFIRRLMKEDRRNKEIKEERNRQQRQRQSEFERTIREEDQRRIEEYQRKKQEELFKKMAERGKMSGERMRKKLEENPNIFDDEFLDIPEQTPEEYIYDEIFSKENAKEIPIEKAKKTPIEKKEEKTWWKRNKP